MFQQLLITLGSGVASAVFFFIPIKGSYLALVMGLFAPLPLMIVSLGFGIRAGVIAAFLGALLVAIMLHYWLALAFVLSVALPAVLLSHVVQNASGASQINAPAPFIVETLLAWIAGVTIALDWFGILSIGLRYPTFDAAVEDLAARFAPLVAAVFERSSAFNEINVQEFAGTLVLAMGPVMAIWGVFALALNFWLAGRVVQISGRLARPWPDVTARLGLPRSALIIFVLTIGLALLPGAIRVFAATAAAGIAAVLALQGLAIVHWRTRGNPARVGILTAVYGATLFIFPWPLVLLAGLGFADLATGSRLRKSNPTVSTKKT